MAAAAQEAGSRGTRHLRARDDGPQATTGVELFFDLVYVFAITQISHLLIDDLSWRSAGHAAFLVFVVWWAWIYTTWLVNWLNPDSTPVRLVLLGVMLASLLMAAALPKAFGADRALFVGAYLTLQIGRNVVGAVLTRGHGLARTFTSLTAWSVVAGALWLAGALAPADQTIGWWGAALAVEVVAPLINYWLPGRPAREIEAYALDGSHFADRFQGFVMIVLGESIVITGATAAGRGLSATVVLCLAVAFVETAALWWLYFDEVAIHSRHDMETREDLYGAARDAYSYLHLPIVAGILVAAVGDDLLIAGPDRALSAAGAITVLGGPILFLIGDSLFRLRMIGTLSPKRVLATAVLCVLAAIATSVSALVLTGAVTVLLCGLAAWEHRGAAPGRREGVFSRAQPAVQRGPDGVERR